MFPDKQLLILQILFSHYPEEMFGRDIIVDSNGQLSQGNIYVYLSEMEERGEISSRKEELSVNEKRLPRSLYRLTKWGEQKLSELSSETIDNEAILAGGWNVP